MSSFSFRQAVEYWRGRTGELKNQLKYFTNINTNNYFELIKIWRDLVFNSTNPNNLTSSDLLRFVNNDKAIIKTFDRLDNLGLSINRDISTADLLKFANNEKVIKSSFNRVDNLIRKIDYSNNLMRFVNDEKVIAKTFDKIDKMVDNDDYFYNPLRFINDEKNISRSFNRIDKFMNKDESNDWNQFLNIMNSTNLSLSELHNQTISIYDTVDNYKIEAIKNLIQNINLSKEKILIKIDALTPGNDKPISEFRRLTGENILKLIDIIDNMGYEMDDNLGYELGKISSHSTIVGITIIDINSLPDDLKLTKKRVTPGFFNWLIKPSPFDLSRYQIYSKIDDIDVEPCFIHSLRMKGVDNLILKNIKYDLEGIQFVTLKTIEHIAEKYNLHINVKGVYPDKFYNHRFPRNDMYRTDVEWIELCYFTVQGVEYPEHIIPYDKNIYINFNYFKVDEVNRAILNLYPLDQLMKFSRFNIKGPRFDELKGNPIDSVKLLRQLHNLQNSILIPLTESQKNYLLNKSLKNYENEVDFEINPWAFNLMKTPNEFIKNPDDIYLVSSNIENIIRKCVSGLGPRISKKQFINEPIVVLDLNSCHANAGLNIKIPKGLPKRYDPESFNLKNIISAYLLIDIIKINKFQKFPVVRDLKIGQRFVDLITLQDLIKYHKIEYEIIDGIYYDGEFIKIDKEIEFIYNQRLEAKRNGYFDMADELKKTLNIKLYGNSLKRKRLTKCNTFIDFEEAFKNMVQNENVKKMTFNKNMYKLSIKKRWTDSYNMAYLGCSILSMARRIINGYIYKLENNGIEVLYSNMDSLFIRLSDFDKFNELFPNSIGDNLGQFHYDYDDKNYKFAKKGIFIGKGQYILKFDDDNYMIRNIGGYIKNPSWKNYMKLIK